MKEHLSLGLLGAGPQAKEIVDYAEDQNLAVDFMAVDPHYLDPNNLIETIDINNPSSQYIERQVMAAVGAPAVKKTLVDAWPGNNYATLVAKSAWVSSHAEIGEGSLVAPHAAITREALLGRHVLINLGVTISHDVKVGDFSTVSPGAHIGGRVELGKGVFVGLGANIKNDIKIADGVVIGAGAVVLKDIEEENSVVTGVPARIIKTNPGWLSEI